MKPVRTILIDPTAVPPQLASPATSGGPKVATQRSGFWDWIDWLNKHGARSIKSSDSANENPEQKSDSDGSKK